MPIAYTLDREKRLIHENWSGEVQISDLREHWIRYLADADVLKIRRTIVDLREAKIRFSGTDFYGLIRTLVLPVLKNQKWTTAIVVAEPAQFGLSRQYQVYAESYSQDAIFSSVAEAEKWIDSQDSSAR